MELMDLCMYFSEKRSRSLAWGIEDIKPDYALHRKRFLKPCPLF
jgi:hypothetical protein